MENLSSKNEYYSKAWGLCMFVKSEDKDSSQYKFEASVLECEEKLNLFISYSHKDEDYIDEFKKHISLLEQKDLEVWYDRKIIPGEKLHNKINDNLEDAEIICLFISANFLSSDYCIKEKNRAIELRKKKGISVIPIILSPCGWTDNKDLRELMALPEDGKPVSSYQDQDDAWFEVYKGLKKVIEKEIKIRQLKITEEFEFFLQDTEGLTKAHSQKESVFLDDIFIYPELDKYDFSKKYKEEIER